MKPIDLRVESHEVEVTDTEEGKKMKSRRGYFIGAGIALTVVALALLTAAAVGAFRTSGSVSAAAPRPSHDGIKVHGRWTITVRDHGHVIARRKFENALCCRGTLMLASLLNGDSTAKAWALVLAGTNGNEPCVANGSPAFCWITEPGGAVGGHSFQTLERTANSGTFVLSGNAVADRDGAVSAVNTFLTTTADGDYFTSKVLASPVPVSVGQQVHVTVNISFS